MRSFRRQAKAFTLIELLVVAGIISLLLAILVPTLGKARERARRAVCQTHMHGWAQGFLMYAGDNNDQLPLDGGDGTVSHPIGVWSDPWLWFNAVVQYMGNGNKTYDELQLLAKNNHTPLPKRGANSFFICPSMDDPGPAVGDGSGSGDQMTQAVPAMHTQFGDNLFATTGWYSGNFTEQRGSLMCYAMNSQLRVWNMDDWHYQTPNPPATRPGSDDINKVSLLKPASMVALVIEKRINPAELLPLFPNQASDPVNLIYSYKSGLTQAKAAGNRFSARHNFGGNIAYADGHVEWFLNKDIDNPKYTSTNYYNVPNKVTFHPSP